MARQIPKLYLLGTVSAAALSLGAGYLARRRSLKAAAAGRLSPPLNDDLGRHARKLTRNILQYFVVPLWTGAGIADWWCHRSSKIQTTTGLKETIIHLLMLAEAGFPVIAGLFLEIDPTVLSAMIAAFFLHEATAMWDVSYAVTAREVTPIEQHVHSFLEIVPLMAVAFVSLLHWPQLQALAGLRVEPPTPIQWKREPLNSAYALTTLGAMLTLELLPYVEEALRDWRAHPGRLVPPAARVT